MLIIGAGGLGLWGIQGAVHKYPSTCSITVADIDVCMRINIYFVEQIFIFRHLSLKLKFKELILVVGLIRY